MIRYLCLLCIAVTPWIGYASPTSTQLVAQFEKELVQAQRHYHRQNKMVLKQRQPKVKTLHTLERELAGLRQQLSANTRAEDEQYLSVETLKKRLDLWQQQNQYINNLLHDHFALAGTNTNKGKSDLKLQLSQQLSALSMATAPQWQAAEAIQHDGRVLSGQSLRVGPNGWFVSPDGVLAMTDNQQTPAAITWRSPEPLTTKPDLIAEQPWLSLPLDVTSGAAITIATTTTSPWQHVAKGGLWVYPILLFGAIALLTALLKLFKLRRVGTPNAAFAAQFVAKPASFEQPNWQQSLATMAYTEYHASHEQLADRLHQQLLLYKAQLDKGMAVIAATAAVAPLLGLLGTVSGMINTFKMMNLFGNEDPTLLSGGISQALITTELGLVVAIPALLLHAYLSRKHQSYLLQLEADSQLLCHLHSQGAGHD